MNIRPATPDDLPAIAAIQQASPEASSWAPFDYTCDVAVEDGRVAGFIVTRNIAPGECEILNLAVDPYYRRRGIAKALVQHAVGRTPGRWFLEVRESNVSGLKLYTSLGFLSAG